MNSGKLARGFGAALLFVSGGCTQAVDDAERDPIAEAAQADQGRAAIGYAFVNANGTVDTNSTSTAGNPPIRAQVSHHGTGIYTVTFWNEGSQQDVSGHQGMAQVSAYGSTNGWCEMLYIPTYYTPNLNNAGVQVVCFDAAGNRKDTPFIVTLNRRNDTFGVEGGYLAAEATKVTQSFVTSSTATEEGLSAWNSTGQEIRHDRYAAGIYLVTFKGQTYSGGTAQVTAVTDSSVTPTRCQINGYAPYYGDYIAWVLCTDTYGNYVDTGYSLSLTHNSPSGLPSFSYALADLPSPSGTYVPLPEYQTGVHGGQCQVHTRSPITITPRSGSTGVYDVTFPEMGTFAGYHAPVTVTAFGGYGEHCNILSKAGIQNGAAYAAVACYDTNGTPIPTQFIISLGLDVGIIC